MLSIEEIFPTVTPNSYAYGSPVGGTTPLALALKWQGENLLLETCKIKLSLIQISAKPRTQCNIWAKKIKSRNREKVLSNIISLTEHKPISNTTWACQMDQVASQNIFNINRKYSSLPAEPQSSWTELGKMSQRGWILTPTAFIANPWGSGIF